jgi:hypothetical protein
MSGEKMWVDVQLFSLKSRIYSSVYTMYHIYDIHTRFQHTEASVSL